MYACLSVQANQISAGLFFPIIRMKPTVVATNAEIVGFFFLSLRATPSLLLRTAEKIHLQSDWVASNPISTNRISVRIFSLFQNSRIISLGSTRAK